MRRHRAMSRTSSSDALAILTVDASGIDLSFPERLERDPVRVDRRRDAGIQRDHQADFADLVGCAAVGERAVDVDLELGGPVDRRASEEEVRDIALWRRMREHNYRIVGKYPEGQNVWLNAKDPQGNFLGGFRGEIRRGNCL